MSEPRKVWLWRIPRDEGPDETWTDEPNVYDPECLVGEYVLEARSDPPSEEAIQAAYRVAPHSRRDDQSTGSTGVDLSDVDYGAIRRMLRAAYQVDCPGGPPRDELAKFFREEETQWGYKGDYENWSPERAAIELIRDLRATITALRAIHATEADV